MEKWVSPSVRLGDTVNLASRLEGANRIYNSRLLVSEATDLGADAKVEVREIDRVVVAGQSTPEAVLEVMGRKGRFQQRRPYFGPGIQRGWPPVGRGLGMRPDLASGGARCGAR